MRPDFHSSGEKLKVTVNLQKTIYFLNMKFKIPKYVITLENSHEFYFISGKYETSYYFFPKIMLCRLVRIIWILYGHVLMFIY